MDDLSLDFQDQGKNIVPFDNCVLDDRGLPFAEAAERGVLAAVLMDAALLPHCMSRLFLHAFHSPKHRILWATITHIWDRHGMIDEIQVFSFLRSNTGKALPMLDRYVDPTKSLMEQIGGIPEFTGLQSTLDYMVEEGRLRIWVDQILHAYTCRQGVTAMDRAIERIRGGESISEVFSDVRWRLERLEQQQITDNARPITEYKIPPKDDESILLGANRYLCRGGSMIIAGPSSMGKSSMSIQMAICFALGKDFLGIPCRRPLKSLIVQAEDDDGDIAEVWESIRATMELSERELAMVRKNIVIILDKTHIGDAFVSKLEGYIRTHQPDLVFLNPLLSYVGGDLTKQEVAGAFLRNGLNRINREDKWAYIIVHHTTKPSKDKSSKWQDQMYNMAGAAELVNWARAIMIVEPLEEEGQFLLNLAKRGKRAGVRELDESSPYGAQKLVTKIPAQHATGTVVVDGRTLPKIVWQLSATAKAARDADKKPPQGREPVLSWDDIKSYVPVGFDAAKKLAEIQRNLISDGIIDAKQKKSVYRRIKDAEERGIVVCRQDQRYYRASGN